MRFSPTPVIGSRRAASAEAAVAKLAANCDDVNIARFRYRTKFLISRVPQVGNLTCERIVDHERVGDLVKHRLGLSNYDGGSCLSKRARNLNPASGVGLKPPVRQRGREFEAGRRT